MNKLVLAALCLWAAAALAAAPAVHVTSPWSRATPPGTTVGVGYFTLHNATDRPQKLVSLSSPRAASVEMHETRVVNGVASMHPLAAGVVIPPHGMVSFEPNGRHLMLMGLTAPLKAGERVPLSLRFEGEDTPVQAQLEVRPLGATGPSSAHGTMQHGHSGSPEH